MQGYGDKDGVGLNHCTFVAARYVVMFFDAADAVLSAVVGILESVNGSQEQR
jgi:hypothetical protein